MKLERTRMLGLDPALHPRGQPHLSSASGLVCIGEHAYVIADDEHHLGVFDLVGDAPGRLLRWVDGDLPTDAAARKAVKPDLETLFVTPPFDGHPHGAMMAFGSGSRPQREQAVWMALDPGGQPTGQPRNVSLSPLYAALHARFEDLNIEGAFVDQDRLRLLQRGHAGRPDNACISFDWDAIALWLAGGPVPAPVSVVAYDLGDVDGVPLCFTDGAALGGGAWIFCAVAEATASSYLDGTCTGSAIGAVAADGSLKSVRRLPVPWKVEGINAVRDAHGWQLRLVTDADDPAIGSCLLETHWR